YNQPAKIELARAIPADQPYTHPYFLASPRQGDAYTVHDQQLIGLAETPPVLRLRTRIRVAETAIELVRPVHHRYVDRGFGERTPPLIAVPPVAVDISEEAVLFPSAAPRQVNVVVQANVAKAQGDVRLDLPPGWTAAPVSRPFQIAEKG